MQRKKVSSSKCSFLALAVSQLRIERLKNGGYLPGEFETRAEAEAAQKEGGNE